MRRLHLFELEDQAWFPATIRDLATDYLHFMQNAGAMHRGMLPFIEEALKGGCTTHIVDLCSGGTGPVPAIVKELREQGVRAGLFRPITVWPFPIEALRGVIDRARRLVVVEASSGQLEDEVRLALSHADVDPPPISHVRRQGGILPSQAEIVEHDQHHVRRSRRRPPRRRKGHRRFRHGPSDHPARCHRCPPALVVPLSSQADGDDNYWSRSDVSTA